VIRALRIPIKGLQVVAEVFPGLKYQLLRLILLLPQRSDFLAEVGSLNVDDLALGEAFAHFPQLPIGEVAVLIDHDEDRVWWKITQVVRFFWGYVEHVDGGLASEHSEDLPLQTEFLRFLDQPSQVPDFHRLKQGRSHAHLRWLEIGSVHHRPGAFQQVDFRTNQLVVLVDLFQEVTLLAQKLHLGPNVLVDVVKEHMRGLSLLDYAGMVVLSSFISNWIRVVTLGGRADPGVHT
jgi:hypothetical protein